MKELLTLLLITAQAHAFCGFYVAGAGASLYNNASEVIMVRQDNTTVLTMRNDYQGEVKQFAMVVPVPVVLRRDQIRLADSAIFSYLDAYSMPRLVEYYDDNPCERRYQKYEEAATAEGEATEERPENSVTIEAQYQVGEYDIILLSATESGALEKWLVANGYHIPDGAKAILAPYIRDKLKFFVVKVNLDRFEEEGYTSLRPLQIKYESPRFMLPIRLGMANAKTGESQDLIVYAFTQKGRVECSNYRTVEMPTDVDIPGWLMPQYGYFYKSVFQKSWDDYKKKAVFLEYGWNLDGNNFTKCDPCTTNPPTLAQMREAGVFWLTDYQPEEEDYTNAPYSGQLYFTRLHIRYTQEDYPEDLMLTVTPNRKNYQVRFIMRHAASGDLSCAEGSEYKQRLYERKQEELENVRRLTGWKELPTPKGEQQLKAEGVGYIPVKEARYVEENKPMSKGDQWVRILIIVGVFLAMLIFIPPLFRKVEKNR